MPSENKKPAIATKLRATEKILKTAAEIYETPASDKDISYMARQLVQATLPHSDPKRESWTRKNGRLTLTIQAGLDVETGKSYGLPFGTIPRLLLFWMTSEAVKTKSRRLELGDSLSGFMAELGIMPTGGRWGTIRRLRDQIERTLSARFSFVEKQDGTEGKRWLHMEIAPAGELWWDYKNPHQRDIFGSWLELGEHFYEAITAAPIPMDIRALKALTKSPLALDLYALMTYEAYKAHQSKQAHFIPWAALHAQMGAEYADIKDFKKKVKAAMRKVRTVYPALCALDEIGGLRIVPDSLPSVHSKD